MEKRIAFWQRGVSWREIWLGFYKFSRGFIEVAGASRDTCLIVSSIDGPDASNSLHPVWH